RDFHVTGVQTCALPISSPHRYHHSFYLPFSRLLTIFKKAAIHSSYTKPQLCWESCGKQIITYYLLHTTQIHCTSQAQLATTTTRSEERRVGKECISQSR